MHVLGGRSTPRADTCVGGAVFLLGVLPRFFHPGENLFGKSGIITRAQARFAWSTFDTSRLAMVVTASPVAAVAVAAAVGERVWGWRDRRWRVVFLWQTGAHAAPIQVFRFGQGGGVAKRLEGAGGSLVVVLHMSSRLERLWRGTVVPKTIGSLVGVSPKERGGVVIGCFLHRWGSPRFSLAATRLLLTPSWKDIGTAKVTW